MLSLGLGTIGIGRPWGNKVTIPDESHSLGLIHFAVENGISFFDTAPAYGESERILGKALKELSAQDRSKITVATKFGEYWNASDNSGFAAHDFETVIKGIDTSLDLLGGIDLLQLHKPSSAVLQSEDFSKIIAYARSCKIEKIGISFSDVATAEFALKNNEFDSFQFPFNADNADYAGILNELQTNKKETLAIINRPFSTGKKIEEGFAFAKKHVTQGIVLTGTTSSEHLKHNIRDFYNL